VVATKITVAVAGGAVLWAEMLTPSRGFTAETAALVVREAYGTIDADDPVRSIGRRQISINT
jgi:hypothetical protein